MKKTKIIVAALIIFSAAISGSAGNAGDFVGPTVGISQMDSDSDDRLLGGLKIDLEYLYSGKISDIFVFRFFNSNDMSFRTEEIGIAMKGGGIIIFEGIDKKVYQTEVVNFTVGPRSEYIKLIPIPIAMKSGARDRYNSIGAMILKINYSYYKVYIDSNRDPVVDTNPIEVSGFMPGDSGTIFSIELRYPIDSIGEEPNPAREIPQEASSKTTPTVGAIGVVIAVIAAIIVRKTK